MNITLSLIPPLDVAPEPGGSPLAVILLVAVLLVGLVIGLVIRARGQRGK